MKFKKALRIAGLVLMILLAMSGIGIVPPSRMKDFENEVRIELVEKKKDDVLTDVNSEKTKE
jgi:hypothetical protein